MHIPSSMQWESSDKVISCVFKNREDIERFMEGFLQQSYYGSMVNALFLNSLFKLVRKCYRNIAMTRSSARL